MSKKDYYEVLGVSKQASADELKKAYRKLAMQYHPDRNQGDKESEKKFKELNEAYEILKDEQKRSAYDRFGHAAFEGGMGGGRTGGGFGSSGFDFGFGGSFTDIFEEMFGEFMGGGGSQRRSDGARKGADLRYNMTITLEEAFNGMVKKIHVPTNVKCEACNGYGTADGKEPPTCETCGGIGRVRIQQGFFTVERACPNCGGLGKAVKNKCKVCNGSGRVKKEKVLEVKIPEGVEEGTRIRLMGEGEAGTRGGAMGDLYIFITIEPHKIFKKDGANLYIIAPISVVTASLGGYIEVPSIDGSRARITIPKGTQTDHVFRLKGKGMNIMNSSHRGDMFVKVRVETPTNLTKKQEELLVEFEKESKEYSPESSNFLNKIKEFWENVKEKADK
ncbi:MAG: molecular chaperone DnaJ [Alphaproteobacteria bacterium]